MKKKILQPDPVDDALGRYAEASLALAGHVGDADLQRHASSLAKFTQSDLVLLYEELHARQRLELAAHWGLPPEATRDFRYLDAMDGGAGGLRSGSHGSAPQRYDPLTQDLQDLGIRAFWAFPLWHEGDLLGQLFFGSRRWDEFHPDTLSVFAATTIEVARALHRRKSSESRGDDQASWSERGDASGIKRRQQFIAVLAHELRNPIAPIRSGLDLIAKGAVDPTRHRDTVRMMQRQLGHLVRLIDDLLDTVRLSTGKLQIKREQVVLREVLASAVESIRPALRAKHQALDLDDRRADVLVNADPVRLSQAFVNILSANTRESPEDGIVTVSVAPEADGLVVTFKDQGPGIEAADIANVFELFPKSAGQKSDEGLGIGLGLVKGLIELNDGTVEVRNRADRAGAEYRVTLPLCDPPEDQRRDGDGAAQPHWSSHRILVVDDNRDAAETLALLLELEGYTVRLAHDGPSAVSQAEEFQPEVILMDIGLPGFSGIEATERLRALDPEVRPYIVALTGWGADSDRNATKEAGFDLHLVKPVSHEELRLRIEAVMSGALEND